MEVYILKSIPYSIPPSRNRIPAEKIISAVRETRNYSSNKALHPFRRPLEDEHFFFLSSGRAALWLIMKALSILKPDKREVIIPAYTCPAIASAVLKAGLRPILVDINLQNFGFERQALERTIGHNTLAVILVHLLGFPANIDEVNTCCKHNEIFLIEDCAQAFGNSMLNEPEKKLGFQADAGFFSFGRGKPLSVLHGGLSVTGSENIFQTATEIYKNIGEPSRTSSITYAMLLGSYILFSNPHLYWIPERLPFLHLGETIFEPDFEISKALRFPELLLGEMMDLVGQEQEIRKRNSSWYSDTFNDIPRIRKPPVSAFPYLRYPLILEEVALRDRILEGLKHCGTGAALFYPCPLNELTGLREVLQDGSAYTNSKMISNTLITLPVHSGVTPRVFDTIQSVVIRAISSVN